MRACLLTLLAGAFLACDIVQAGEGEPGPDVREFLSAFLQEHPRFRASGILTSQEPGQKPVACGARATFDRESGAVFAYNTNGEKDAKDPFDFYYWNRSLTLLVYDRTRSERLKHEDLGAPYRTVFNFVWDVLKEAESGPGFKSLIFSGLMHMEIETRRDGTRLSFERRLGALPVREIVFTFDRKRRLKTMTIIEGNGSSHLFQVRSTVRLKEPLAPPPAP